MKEKMLKPVFMDFFFSKKKRIYKIIIVLHSWNFSINSFEVYIHPAEGCVGKRTHLNDSASTDFCFNGILVSCMSGFLLMSGLVQHKFSTDLMNGEEKLSLLSYVFDVA